MRVLAALSAPRILNPEAYSGVYISCLNLSRDVLLRDIQLAKKKRHSSAMVKIGDFTFIQILIRKKISGCSRVAKIGLIISLFLFSLEFSSDLFLFDVSLPQKFWCHSSDATEEW